MRLSWLGQAGYKLISNNGLILLIDPYLSDSLHCEYGDNYLRQVPINEQILCDSIDVLIVTHSHSDHMDSGTLDLLFENSPNISVLAPRHVSMALKKKYGGNANYMIFEPGLEISLGGVLFRAVHAYHSDLNPIGVVVEGDGKIICHTGDTLFHRQLVEEYPHNADALLLPVNGKGNNMNCLDAARLTKKLRPKAVFPMHWDMFRQYGCDVNEFIKLFENENQRIVIPRYYEEIEVQ